MIESFTLTGRVEMTAMACSHVPARSWKFDRLFRRGDVVLHFRELFEKAGFHGPVLKVVGVFEKDLGDLVPIVLWAVCEDVAV